MATRKIPDPYGGRTRKTSCVRELISEVYGATRHFGPCPLVVSGAVVLDTGGSSMDALLGPDVGNGVMLGSKTNSTSLQPLMGLLNTHSTKNWKAGHLLNADLGGSGTRRANLTPLTAAANTAHKTFEQHVKRMLLECYRIDRAGPDLVHWYGVRYQVTVDPTPYANVPAVGDMHSYAYSHIVLHYHFVTLDKFPPGVPPHTLPSPPNTWNVVAPADPYLGQLQRVMAPAFTPSPNIGNWVAQPDGITFDVEIHNEP